jgi:hypothetical protein
MITQLTDTQLALIPIVRDEWLQIGLSCEPLDLPRAKLAVRKAYRAVKLEPPTLWFVADSPLSGAIMATILRAQVGDQVWDQVRAQVGDQVCAPVRDQVVAQVWAHVGAQVRDQVGDQVWAQVGAQVWAQVWAQVGDQVWAQVGAQVRAQVGDQVFGSHDASWLAFYDFFRRVGLREVTAPLTGLSELARSCGWWAPYQGAAILQHRHIEVHLVDGILHRDEGPAVLYRDGFAVWALHGVRVPRWLAETSTGRIDPKRMLELDNAQVRAEFVRKVGLERLRRKLSEKVLHAKVVTLKTPLSDSWPCNYSVERLNYGNGIVRHVLVMDNPSLPEVQHVEYIPTSCETVEAAMNFRLNRTEKDVDDVHGSPYWLHGDVVITPKGAAKTKRWPEVAA